VTEPLLQVEDLRVAFPDRGRELHAVDGVSYCVYAGQTLAVVGESGSGKTVSCRAVMGLLPPTAVITGSARFQGIQLIGLTDDQLRAHRGADVAMVFQDPSRSLNPTMRIGSQIAEAVRAHQRVGKSRPSSCCAWCACRCRSGAAPSTRTSCPAACGSGS
jgi:ABC-type microcin C transport system duplicated ATPase subunit YejF